MPKTIAYAGALAAALLVASAGTAAAQSSELFGSVTESVSGAGSSGLVSGSSDMEGDYLGSVGEMAPASVTGSLPGYATGPLGSTATLFCNVGSAAGLAANVTGMPLPIPVSAICSVANPLAQSGDAVLEGDFQGSVDAVIGGIPVVGTSVTRAVDTSSVAEQVEDLVGDRLGSLAETSLSPGN
ncbi:MAG TPA: hypothetical protein H9878_06040 [Candidatus Dietzia merdigallinarum]|nr:hypothetical protein [Candidatus Dietzia merdigallinarum]